jgi:hypothetical protein
VRIIDDDNAALGGALAKDVARTLRPRPHPEIGGWIVAQA